jgi:hypothetical protein
MKGYKWSAKKVDEAIHLIKITRDLSTTQLASIMPNLHRIVESILEKELESHPTVDGT